jgi:hypothetical protein
VASLLVASLLVASLLVASLLVASLLVASLLACHSPWTSHQRAVFTHGTAADWMFFVCRSIFGKP